jgi:hypothetical protein
MSPIPGFEKGEKYCWGVLPPGVHACTDEEFTTRFAFSFPSSTTRAEIVDGFTKFRDIAKKLEIGLLQWIDGSFVEEKVNPNDVDVISFADYEILNALNEGKRNYANDLLGTGKTRDLHTRSFFQPSCSPKHPYFPVFENQRQYWRRWFGHTRQRRNSDNELLDSIPKGMVKMWVGPSDKVPVISEEGGN